MSDPTDVVYRPGPDRPDPEIPENDRRWQRIHSLTLFSGASQVTAIPTNALTCSESDSSSDRGDSGDGGRKDDCHTSKTHQIRDKLVRLGVSRVAGN